MGATAAHGSQPAKLFFIRPGSPAALSGIQTDDVVVQLGGKKISNAAEFLIQMSSYWPGDTVTIKLKRKSVEMVKTIALIYPSQVKYNHPAENFAGGKSQRRDGFNNVYIYDVILKPWQCGTPFSIRMATFAESVLLASAAPAVCS
jgi:serine protease Do